MDQLFSSILSASFHGSIIILLVLAARLVLRKAPRSTICLLWVMVGLRLLLPFQIESSFSLQPEMPQFTQQSVTPTLPEIQPDHAVIPDRLPPDVTITYDDNAVTQPTIRVVNYKAIAAIVWIAVACGMAGYTLISYLHLKRKVSGAELLEDGVYESSAIDSPFLLGYIKPNIYLPKGLSVTDRRYILAHERGHMERGDNWIKLAGFVCVSIHWFNPLVWLGYHLLCKDIEMACDEYVVKHMDLDSRKGYSAALVNCSTQRRFGACPVAFGEVSVKQRVLSVLHYRKPGFWISLACLVVIGFVAACFMTNPITVPEETTSTEETVPDDQSQILEQCKNAFTQFVSGGTYEIQVTTKYQSNSGIMDYSTETQFLRSGEDWFRHYTIYEHTFEKTVTELAFDGTVYKRSYLSGEEPTQWATTNDTAKLSAPWTMAIDWEHLTYKATDAALGSRGHSFLLNGEEDNIITFCFDGGNLTSVLHTFDIITQMDTISHVAVDCKLVSNDARWILETINRKYREQGGVITNEPDQLQKCKDALTMIQSQDSYYMRVYHENNNPDVLLGSAYDYYWRSDEDYLQCEWKPDWENWCLYTQGQYYEKDVTIAVPPEDIPYPQWTRVQQPGLGLSGVPWIMNIRWEEAKPAFLADGITESEEIITVVVEDPEPEYPYTLTFHFDLISGGLNSVCMTRTFQSLGAVYTSTSTIDHFSFDSQQVKAEIEKTYLETQLQVIQ